ncbi:hypothetical protein HPB48_011291 [Haemaphysalis longicornis]|uniref:Uncharacterized protein n=1 Tax=Haemaphysalis longicornis TaxID=44386 RepID=A0A9J6GXX8_HAELO|nr:hypothetical protein HPB48_011291 [Haemaphysalis longicornis]
MAEAVGGGRSLPVPVKWRPMPLPFRAYIYAIQGYFIEVTFTALYDLLVGTGGMQLRGCSSIWSLFIYSVATLVMERVSTHLRQLGLPLPVIALAHTLWMYAWEFTTGCLLRAIGGCSWDYKHYRYNFAGLVTLEYAPLWFLLGVTFELFYAPNIKRFGWLDNSVSWE